MFGDLPPSSVVEGIRFWAAYCMIIRPVPVSPVNATFAMRLLDASAMPTSAPGPFTMLMTPGGRTGSMSSINLRMDHGVGLAGLIDRDIARRERRGHFQAAIRIGKLNGMICPTTPSGSRNS